MALRNVPYAAQTNPTMVELDQTFADVSALGTVPCTAAGTNAITLTPNTNTPTISAYTNYQAFSFVAVNTTTGPVTVQVGALGALNLYLPDGVTQATSNNLFATAAYTIIFNSALGGGGGGFQFITLPYAQNSFQPTLIGDSTPGTQTYTTQTGAYVVKGNDVTVYGRVVISAKDAAIAGNAQIGNLPFTSSNISTVFALAIAQYGSITLNPSYTQLGLLVGANGTTANLNQSGSAQGALNVLVSGLGTTSQIIFSGSYRMN